MFRELKCVMAGKLYNIRYFVRAVTELLKWKMNNKWPTVLQFYTKQSIFKISYDLNDPFEIFYLGSKLYFIREPKRRE